MCNTHERVHGQSEFLAGAEDTESMKSKDAKCGLDHGVGHPLLLLYDAKAAKY
jgi:hypothetical protein